jgi:hypothetical protein
MKKALIPVTAVLAVALAPCAATIVGSGDNIPSSTGILAGLFWHVVDTIRERELNCLISEAPANGLRAITPEFAVATVAPMAVNFVLGRFLPEASAPAAKQICAPLSISACMVRRIVERELATVREGSARCRRSRQNRG